MRNSRLRKADAFFNITRAKAWSDAARSLPRCPSFCHTFLEGLQNSAPRRIGNGVQRAVEGSFGCRHG